MNALPNEKEITSFAGVKLTTHRVRFDAKKMGAHEIKSIMLEQVASCSMAYKSYFFLLLIAAIALIAGFVEKQMMIPGLIGAAVFVAAFFGTRKLYLTIGSAGDSISLLVVGQNTENIIAFIDKIEEAKDQRFTGKASEIAA